MNEKNSNILGISAYVSDDSDTSEKNDVNNSVLSNVVKDCEVLSSNEQSNCVVKDDESIDDQGLLPSTPNEDCDKELLDKVNRVYHSFFGTGTSLNCEMQKTRSFKNPCIYEKLVQHFDIDQRGTNFDKVCFLQFLVVKIQHDYDVKNMAKSNARKQENVCSILPYYLCTYRYNCIKIFTKCTVLSILCESYNVIKCEKSYECKVSQKSCVELSEEELIEKEIRDSTIVKVCTLSLNLNLLLRTMNKYLDVMATTRYLIPLIKEIIKMSFVYTNEGALTIIKNATG
ncbi:hypothetical protein A3Q56_06587, partial [Intoshia linei]